MRPFQVLRGESMITNFGTLPSGETVQLVTIKGGILRAEIVTYGAALRSLYLDGFEPSLALGTETLEDLVGPLRYFGSTVGRVANRIKDAKYELGGKTYQLENNFVGKHTLHGGSTGVGGQVWSIGDMGPDFVTLTLSEEDGHGGFGGEIAMQVTYRLKGGALEVIMTASSNSETPCNLAHHSYFNLDGEGNVDAHRLRIDAETYVPLDAELIPTGDPISVEGTKLDFRQMRTIGSEHYDNNLCVSSERVALREVARVEGATSGIALTVETTEPGLQIYNALHLTDEGTPGLDGRIYRTHAGLALETQVWPDAINRETFPDCIIGPNKPYESITRYVFTRD